MFTIVSRFILLLFMSSLLYAQSENDSGIEVTFINPVGFIAPGRYQNLYIHISNPAESNQTITRFVRYEEEQLQLPSSRPLPPFPECNYFGCQHYYTFISVARGRFPLQPGESLVARFGRISADGPYAAGDTLGFEKVSFSFSINDETVNVVSKNKVIYVVSENGLGDSAILDEYDVYHPQIDFMQLEGTYHYPSELLAGQHFNLRVTWKNTGDVSITGFRRVEEAMQLYKLTGIDEDLYEFQECGRHCIRSGELPLVPGASFTYEVGNFYYRNSQLVNRVLEVPPLEHSFSDEDGVSLFIYPDSPPIEIAVSTPSQGQVPNSVDTLPERLALQVQDLIAAGDELVIHDPNTGYDWISPDASKGFSYADIMQLLRDHPDLNGFELAEKRQIEELLLNHIHSEGVASAFYDLWQPEEEINDAALSFTRMAGAAVEPPFWPDVSSRHTLNGVVADEAKRHNSDYASTDVIAGTVMVKAFEDFPASNSPSYRASLTHLSSVNVASLGTTNLEVGYWLVRTGEEKPAIEGPRLLHDQLVLPAVRVGDEFYTVKMRYANPLVPYMELLSLELLNYVPTHVDAVFDWNDQTLTVPELNVLNTNGEFDRIHAQMLRTNSDWFQIQSVVELN
ncbi:MAG: hypothetical protein R3332_10745 [Pseudohongiellaceae bacterium]|nr:hypothetical protein [Pseudohongiellaceae bacterium]